MKTAARLLFVFYFSALSLSAASPTLSVSSQAGSLQLSWPAAATGFQLEVVSQLPAGAAWQLVPGTPTTVGNELRMVLPLTETARFFRLSSPPPLLQGTNFQIGDFELVSSTTVSATEVENIYTATVSNWSGQDATVSATATAPPGPLAITEGDIAFGAVENGDTIRSSDSFTVRMSPGQTLQPRALAWTVRATELPPTSVALIDSALAAGSINSETALAYKIYVEFDPDLLPPSYRGRDDGFPEARAIVDLRERFDTLSPATQQMLVPFLLQPNAPGSWYERKYTRIAGDRAKTSGKIAATPETPIAWDYVDGATANVRIWWDSERRSPAEAQSIANEIDSRIWPALTNLLGAPKPDTDNRLQQPGGLDIPDHSDDERLDIFLTDSGRVYAAVRQACTANTQAAFIDLGVHRSFPSITHELTHAILYRFPLLTGCNNDKYKWLHDATANWAMHYVYPDSQAEWGSSKYFLNKPELPLDYEEAGGTAHFEHPYGAYLWFFYLTEGSTDRAKAQIVRTIWDACAANEPRAAFEQSLGSRGGLRGVWPEFVLNNWNRMYGDEPYRDYMKWDKLNNRAKEMTPDPVMVSLNGKASSTIPLQHLVPNLAAQYFHYDFTADQNIRSLTFRHPYSEGLEPEAHVYAILKIAGQEWRKAEDWTPFAKKKLCRDRPSENFEELVIVISNSEHKDKNKILGGFVAAELEVASLGCNTWEGVVHMTHNASHAAGTRVMTETANVIFEFDEETTGDGSSGIFYRMQQGDFSYSNRYDANNNPPCREIETSSGQLSPLPYQPGVQGTGAYITFYPGDDSVQYFASGLSHIMIHRVDNCTPNNIDRITDYEVDHFWWNNSSGQVSADGKTIEGSSDMVDPVGGTYHTDWKLQKR